MENCDNIVEKDLIFGSISRQQAEFILKKEKQDSFLIRNGIIEESYIISIYQVKIKKR